MSKTSAEVLGVLETAATLKTNKDKMFYLKRNMTDDLKAFIRFALDPSYNFYQTIATLPEPGHDATERFGFDDMICLLEALHTREVSGNAQQSRIAYLTGGMDAATRTLFRYAIQRQLPGKMGRTIVNGAVGYDLVYKQPYGGVKPWDGDLVEKRFNFKGGVMLEQKMDGMTLMINLQNGEVRTRQGQDVTKQMWPYLRKNWISICGQDLVIHVEAQLWDQKYQNMMPRPAANGIFNKIFKDCGAGISRSRMVFTVLDAIPTEVFYGQEKCKDCADDRYALGYAVVSDWETSHNDCTTGIPMFEMVPMCYVYSLEEARGVVQRWISEGKEGGILKDPEGMWSSSKMTNQMKMKNEFECTLMVYGQQAHKKQDNWVGSLLVCSRDGKIKTKVGSGLNEDPDSELCRTDCSNFPSGLLVEVRAEKISKNNALDLPRIIEVRHDKDQADSYEEVLGAYNDSISVNNC